MKVEIHDITTAGLLSLPRLIDITEGDECGRFLIVQRFLEGLDGGGDVLLIDSAPTLALAHLYYKMHRAKEFHDCYLLHCMTRLDFEPSQMEIWRVTDYA